MIQLASVSFTLNSVYAYGEGTAGSSGCAFVYSVLDPAYVSFQWEMPPLKNLCNQSPGRMWVKKEHIRPMRNSPCSNYLPRAGLPSLQRERERQRGKKNVLRGRR